MRMKIEQLCQPDAESPPRILALPAASSRCIGCGSNSEAKAMISAADTVLEPRSMEEPSTKSSNAHFLSVIVTCLIRSSLHPHHKNPLHSTSSGRSCTVRVCSASHQGH